MNSFCRHLGQSLSKKFKIEVDVFVSKKKKIRTLDIVHILSNLCYPTNYLKKSSNILDVTGMREKNIFPGYFFIYLKLNQSLKWCFDYIIIINNKTRSKKNG